MLRKRTTLLVLYFTTLLLVCGLSIVGPMVGGSISNLVIAPSGTTIGCKFVNFGNLINSGTRVSDGDNAVGNFNYAVGMWTNDTDLVKLLFEGECLGSCTGGSLAVDFSFDASGFADPAGLTLSLTGTSNGIGGLLGLFPSGAGTLCSDFVSCVTYSSGAINIAAPTFGQSGGAFTVFGRLILSSLDGSLVIGADSGDIQFGDAPLSGVPEPTSFILVGCGLGALTWLRKRIRES